MKVKITSESFTPRLVHVKKNESIYGVIHDLELLEISGTILII